MTSENSLAIGSGEAEHHRNPMTSQLSEVARPGAGVMGWLRVCSLLLSVSLSSSCLIAMALKNSKTGSLPVSEIYSFMKEHFPYFKVCVHLQGGSRTSQILFTT